MKKTFSNILINGLYQVFLIITPIVTIPYLSRILGNYYLGEYAYYSNILIFLGVVIVFGMNQQGTKLIAESNFSSRRKVFFDLWKIQLLVGSIVALFYVGAIFFSGMNQRYLLLFLPFLFSYLFDLSWFYIGISEVKKVVSRNMIIRLVVLAFIFISIKSKADFEKYIIINSIGMIVSNVVFIFPLKNYLPVREKKHNFHINWRYFKTGFSVLLPLLAVQVYTTLDKVIIGNIAGQVELSYYDQSQKVARVVLALVTSLSVILMPQMAKMNGNKDGQQKLLVKSADYTLIFAGLLTVGLMVNTGSFVPWFFGENFASMVPNMFFSSFIIIFLSYGGVYANQYTLAKGMYTIYAIPSIVGAILNVILNVTLVTRFDSLGGTFSMIITEGVVCFLRLFLLRKDIDLHKILTHQIGIVLSIGATYLIGYFIHPQFSSVILTMAVSAIIMSISYLVFILLTFPAIRTDLKMIAGFWKR